MKNISIKSKGIIFNLITVVEIITEVIFGVRFNKKLSSLNNCH
ncbi:hypothetical protein [Terrisporobacter glycolicus]|uniref:Uncharacterized protein n=1 Tax=Terrisporobacter glycolicus ATCC 14880 = DSM 1288 TaxID=1121315 RepID=A0ABZ2F0H3_9FIRM|nr:hypothetical protein [Terrisporobacter glycolicus]